MNLYRVNSKQLKIINRIVSTHSRSHQLLKYVIYLRQVFLLIQEA